MHVLVLLAQHHWTGAAEPVLQIANGLVARGHKVTFVYTRKPSGHLAGHVEESALRTLPEVKLQRKGLHPLATFADWRRLRAFILEQNVDVVFCHHSHDHWLALASRWGLSRRPVVVRQVHESRHLQPGLDRRWLFGHSDAIIVAALSWQEKLVQNSGLPAERIEVIAPAVDCERFSPEQNTQAIRQEIDAAQDDALVGLVSRIKTGRGHELALAAMEIVRRTKPGARLLFVGRGEGKSALSEVVHSKGAQDWVHFLGYRTADLPAIYAALDVSLLLGEGSDGSCRAALEAIACGTPVAALPVGTLPATLADDQTGYFAAHDPEDLAAKILATLDRTDLGAKAREYALQHFSIQRRVDAAENLFNHLTAGR